jgi:hypothetical protein
MSNNTFKCSKMSDVEALLPGFKSLWPTIKADTGTSQRCPKSVSFTDAVHPAVLHDGECGKRYSLDLRTMTLSHPLHLSSGEWACHAGSNNDQAVGGIPITHALLTVVYHDYYRSFRMTVQVHPDNMPKQLTA